jgi:predicted enzyme related to lactoylglutathione lyase
MIATNQPEAMKPFRAFLLLLLLPTMNAANDSSSSLSLGEIGQIAIHVDDLDRATDFYRDQLGMRHLFSAPGQFSFFQCGSVRLLLGRPEKGEERSTNTLIYFKVADIQAASATMKERNVNFLQQPHVVAEMPDHTLWMASFQDSEENTLLLMSEVPK